MANSLGNGLLNAAYWSKKMQEVRYKELVAMAITNVELRSELRDGDTVHRPYRSAVVSQSYTKGTAFTVQDISATDDTLVVNTARVAPFYLDDIDKIQNVYNTMDEYATDCMDKLNRWVDADVLAEYANATSSVKDNDVGGSTAVAIVPTTANINKIFTAAGRKLTLLNVKQDNRFAVISPSVMEVLQQYTAGKDTVIGDKVMENGYIGTRFGFDLYVSNNLTYTGIWTPSDNPSAGETLTIAGVTFHFVSTIGTTAGNVLQTTNTATTIANLVDLINNPTSTTANHVALSAAQQAALAGCVATDGTTYMSVVFPGGSEVSFGGTAQATASSEIVHCLAGRKKAINLVMQKEPGVVFKDVPDKLGKNVAPWMLYGKKTFNNDKDLLVDIQIDASALS